MCTLDLACRFDLKVEPYLDDAELENLHSICTFEDLVRNEQSFYSRICGGYGFMKAEFGLGSTGSKHCKETALKAPARPGRAWPRPTSRLLGGKPLRVLLPKLILWGRTDCGSPWLINCYLEGNEQLRRNLEALVANGAIVSALFLTVTLCV